MRSKIRRVRAALNQANCASTSECYEAIMHLTQISAFCRLSPMLMFYFPMSVHPIFVIATVVAVVLLFAYLRKRGDL
jgi:hypothetical protein